MAKALKYLHKKKKGTKSLEPCPVCDDELYYSEYLSQKIAIIDELYNVEGWMCPWCESKFDYDDNLVYINMPGNITGKT